MDVASQQDRDTLVKPFLQLKSSQSRRRACVSNTCIENAKLTSLIGSKVLSKI
jgi:hypothetical protein